MKHPSRKQGFTLIELLLVVAIIGILGSMAVMQLGGQGEKASKTTTLASIGSIETAVHAFEFEARRYPKSLEELTRGINDNPPLLKKAALNDSWGIPFEYKVKGKQFEIRSAGPDTIMNTEDDLTN